MLFISVMSDRRSCLSNRTPAKANKIKMLLNTRCSRHDRREIIPPQLHGKSLLKVIIAPMYTVNAIINNRDAYNPFNRQRGIINNKETKNSVRGKNQAINGAKGFKIGDSAICSLNTEYSISLLIPVYRKRMINNVMIVSTIVAFDNQEKEMILTNRFLCTVLPSMVDN